MTAPDQSGITDLSLLRHRGRPYMKHWTDLGYGTLNKPFSARDLDLAIRGTIRSQPRSNNLIRLPSAKA